MGLLITKLNRRGGGIRRRRCPRTQRVLKRSRFMFKCHDTTNINKRERERERERERNT